MGNRPDANLYWGCSDGLKSYFKDRCFRERPQAAGVRPVLLTTQRIEDQGGRREGGLRAAATVIC